ncbi:uncharacterized protein K460DRAFT_295009 [Cucurbitaria berberidis CBS 394.84]|uniref:DUF1772-domain-containing protein n=1 Tax=Cucurbitaria berberidis CBS 394.84 TaxID=1168544 RepID=A0A9P4G8Z6_9PLEO|nr:uncharacterized protein K460DRAFT_295009 [Cucurbitaria berberidis CBS 394.84]KAF1841262.1 hypothetical protein K460DRAFT_295009 [Cucurbitaria berberidis CBS 394.84]
MSVTQTIQILSISTALLASGGIATLTLFDIPLLKSQPASRSLPMTRWLFSRGSHIFPTAALLSSSGFAYLAYSSLPSGTRTLLTLLQNANKGQPGLYLAAAALTLSIGPFTSLMVPTNFSLIKMNEEKGGSRSAASAQYRSSAGSKTRSAEESTDSKDDVSQWTDLSVPQEKTEKKSTKEEDEEAKILLDRFGKLNGVRAVLMGLGGVVGLLGALA